MSFSCSATRQRRLPGSIARGLEPSGCCSVWVSSYECVGGVGISVLSAAGVDVDPTGGGSVATYAAAGEVSPTTAAATRRCLRHRTK